MRKLGKKEIVHEPGTAHTRIKDLPKDDRPREKLIKHGVQALSDSELLAVLIRVGSKGSSALELARGLLRQEKDLKGVAKKTPIELMRVKGVGKAKAVQLLTAFEIGKRVQGTYEDKRPIIHSPEDVAREVVPFLRDLTHEVFVVLILDAKNGLKHKETLTKGTLNASLVHPREVFKVAIDHLAASVIVAHNHPSGNPEPSREDVDITKQLSEAGKIIGIPLHDHVIIAGESYTSLTERGLL
jgi:DNA repair protein RadC